MARTEPSRIKRIVELMGRQLGLFCRHAVGNPSTLPRRKNEGRLA